MEPQLYRCGNGTLGPVIELCVLNPPFLALLVALFEYLEIMDIFGLDHYLCFSRLTVPVRFSISPLA